MPPEGRMMVIALPFLYGIPTLSVVNQQVKQMLRALRIVVVICASVFAASATAECIAPPNVHELATQIAAGLNDSRRAHGERPLRFNRKLAYAAMVQACDMMVHDFFDHRGTDGSSSQTRVRNTGYEECIVGENLAWGYPRSEQIISGWMNSPGHRDIMLHPRIEEFGVGITQGPKGPYWVLVVAKQC